jgi:small-conductance mechanosensitive channel
MQMTPFRILLVFLLFTGFMNYLSVYGAVSPSRSVEKTPSKSWLMRTLERKLEKKLQKIERRLAKSGKDIHELTSGDKLGILLGAVGLLLLILSGAFGGAAPLFAVLGALGLIAGVVIILLEHL